MISLIFSPLELKVVGSVVVITLLLLLFCTRDIIVPSVRPRTKAPPLWFFLGFLIFSVQGFKCVLTRFEGRRSEEVTSVHLSLI